MASLVTLPAEIIQEISRHLDEPPFSLTRCGLRFQARKGSLSLASTTKRLRNIVFYKCWVEEHAMEYSYESVKKSETIGHSVRRHVKTLVLSGDCDGKEVKPTLLDYVRIFPNLVSVRIELVYPRDCSRKQIETSNATSSHPIVPARSTTNRLKTVSVSITKDLTWNGTKQESFTKKIIPQLKASLKAAGIDRLESFHLEIATSRSLEDRDSLDYWSDLGKRIGSACPIPANEVSLDIGEIKMKGEASKFMDMLVSAIQGWPKRIQTIQIVVPTEDFIHDSKNASKFKVNKKGQATLTGGWVPSEKNMLALVASLKKTRPALREFRLVVSVRSAAFAIVRCKPIFDFSYVKREGLKPAKRVSTSLGTKDQPIDVEDFVATSSIKQKRSEEPEHSTDLDQTVIQELYEAMKDAEEDGEMDDDGSEDYGWDEEIVAMQERDNEDAGFDEDDELLGIGGRPRWVAY